MGVQQSMQAEVVAGFSILAFHDCIEMFLLLVAEHNDVKSDSLSFMNYWDKFPNLTLKESMRAVKDRRVSVKHKGQFPSKNDIDISRICVTDFLEQNCNIQFNIQFKDVSLLSLISYEGVKGCLENAEKELENRNYDESLLCSSKAFEELIHSYESNKRNWREDIFDIGDKINKEYESLVGSHNRESKWFEKITETTNKIREALKITAIGIDFKRYSVFRFITPKVYRDMSGNYHSFQKSSEKGIKVNIENCQLCIDFVLDCAIKLQDFDFDLNQYIQE